MGNRLVLVAAAGATALLAAGTGLTVAGTPEPVPAASVVRSAQPVFPSFTNPTSSSPATSPATEAIPAPASEITRDAAASIALAHVGAGRVSQIESEYEHGRHEWKVEIVDGRRQHDVRVDSTTGAITRTDVSDDRGGDDRGRDDNPGTDDRSGRDDRRSDG